MSDKKTLWDAKDYEENFSFVYEYGNDLVALLDPKPGEHILDLGCGTGQLSEIISRSGAEVIGIDKSAEMISQASANYPDWSFIKKMPQISVSIITLMQFFQMPRCTGSWILCPVFKVCIKI